MLCLPACTLSLIPHKVYTHTQPWNSDWKATKKPWSTCLILPNILQLGSSSSKKSAFDKKVLWPYFPGPVINYIPLLPLLLLKPFALIPKSGKPAPQKHSWCTGKAWSPYRRKTKMSPQRSEFILIIHKGKPRSPLLHPMVTPPEGSSISRSLECMNCSRFILGMAHGLQTHLLAPSRPSS